MNPAFNSASLIQSLSGHRVFGLLSETELAALAASGEWKDYPAEATVLAPEQMQEQLVLIVAGEVNLLDSDVELTVQLQTGEWFGFGATPARQPGWQAVAATDARLISLPAKAVMQACRRNRRVAFFLPSLPALETPASAEGGTAGPAPNLLTTAVRTLVKREPIASPPTASIRDVAILMQERRVSSVLLVEQDRLVGLVTDRDLRNRVVAQGLDIHRPVSEIATPAPMTVNANSPAFEALLLMARHNIHHMPVMDGQRIVGMITVTDLIEQHSTSAVYLAGDIYKQTALNGLIEISGRVKHLQQHLAAADASAYSTGHIVTAITDALTVRLIQLAEGQLGPAPIEYVWVAAGSQARNEQAAKSDQDNCLILDDHFDATLHGDYFSRLSKFVCDGLAACGYIHCPGEMMAMNDTWRQPRKVWVEYFRTWIQSPKPKALMLTCVFFDLRAIHGSNGLLESIREEVLVQTRGNSLFLAHMVSNALKHRPPLGMFGNITLIKGGDHPRTIDLKHSGIVPIVDLARIYALAAGVSIANTHDRLEVSAQAGEVSAQSARDLSDAFEFLCKLRISHQARQTRQGNAPDNFLPLEELSNFERVRLKNAFSLVQTLQGVLQQRYSGGLF